MSTQTVGLAGIALYHLQIELQRIDLRLQRAVELWKLAGQDPEDTFRGLYVPDEEASALLHRPLATSWGHTAALTPEAEEALHQRADWIDRERAQVLKDAEQGEITLPLVHLAQTFALSRLELDALLIALAPAVDLRYERLYGYLQDDVTKKRPTVNLILDLLVEGGIGRLAALAHFDPQAPLIRHRLLALISPSDATGAPLLAHIVTVDESIVAFLLGGYRPHALIASSTRFLRPAELPPEHTQAALDGATTSATPESLLVSPENLALLEAAAAQMRAAPSRAYSSVPSDRSGSPGNILAHEPPIFLFHGPDVDSQRAAARFLAGRAGRPLMMIDLAKLAPYRSPGPGPAGNVQGHVDRMDAATDLAIRAVGLGLRDARLTGAIPLFVGWDACLVDGTTPPGLIEELTAHPGVVIVAGEALWYPKGTARAGQGSRPGQLYRPIIQLEFPIPAFPQRRLLWATFLGAGVTEIDGARAFAGEHPDGIILQPGDLDALAGQFALTSGQIRDAVATAWDWVARASSQESGDSDGQKHGLTAEDLFAAARVHSNPRLAQLARRITGGDRPARYGWDDIILPEDQRALLREIIDTVRGRAQVLDAWGVGDKLASSRGVTVLFAGPPGTGKTMAAEIIAGSLGLDLYRIDLSTVVSKYIGETEKNIERIFREAELSNAILFFDEADALFGKRSEIHDSHDRYANIEISYLLQRMEAYDGVTILATNLRGNLDEAFTRRLQFSVSFPFPEAEDRLRIWQTLFPPDLPRDPDINLPYLAERFRLAGGNIRNIIVSAAYLAAADGQRQGEARVRGQVTMAHLLHATRRELQKMGRLVREEEFALVDGHGPLISA